PIELIRKNSRLAGLLGKEKNKDRSIYLIDRLSKIPWQNQVEDDIILKVGLMRILYFSNQLTDLEAVMELGIRLSTVYPQDHNIIGALNQIIAKTTFLKLHLLIGTLINNYSAYKEDELNELKRLHSKWENVKEEYQTKQFELLKETLQALPVIIEKLNQRIPRTELTQFDRLWHKLENDYRSSDNGLTLLGFESMLMDSFYVLIKLLTTWDNENTKA